MTGEIFVGAVLLGLIPAVIARNKGETFWKWWLFGTVLFIAALPMSIIIKGRRCAYCQSSLRAGATVCAKCQREQPAATPT